MVRTFMGEVLVVVLAVATFYLADYLLGGNLRARIIANRSAIVSGRLFLSQKCGFQKSSNFRGNPVCGARAEGG